MRILLSGYYGFGNIGDEAVLEALLRLCGTVWKGVEFVVLSAAPGETESCHKVRACSRWRPDALFRELVHADLFLSGGGSLFQDATSRRSLAYYLAQLELARWVDTPRVVAFQGVGPLRRESSRRAVASVLQDASAIVVRDPESATLLREVGVLSPPIRVAADPALLLTPQPQDRGKSLLKQCGVPPSRPVLAVSLREWPTLTTALPAVCAALRMVRDRRNMSLLLLPLHRRADLDVCRRVQGDVGERCHVLGEELSPAGYVTLLSECALLLGMRLHSLVFAVASGTPVVGLSYDPKVAAFLKQTDQVCAGEVDTVDAKILVHSIDAALDQRTKLVASVTAARDRLRRQVVEATRWLADCLQLQ